MYKYDIRVNPANDLQTPYMLPDDVILNTRRAFSTSPTSATGYSDLGVPEGRYFAPANSADCIQLKAGDCAPRTLLIRAPFFTRIDIGVTKRFPLIGRDELRVARRRAEPVRQRQLQPGGQSRRRRDDLPGDGGLSRSGQHLRSGRPARADLDPVELVGSG